MKSGFKVLDSDMHLREPADLWDKYVEPEWRERAPKILSYHRPQLGNGDDRGKNSSRLQADLPWRHLRCDSHR